MAASPIALRVGAVSIYLVVGLFIGIVAAFVLMAMQGGERSPSFATVVFGVTAICAVVAAFFPSTALAALAPLATFAWGLVNGSLIPESFAHSERDVGALNPWLFWLGVAVGLALLLTWLLV